MAITVSIQIFKNFLEEHAPELPLSRFCYLSCLKLTPPEKKYASKVRKFGAPSQKKFLNTPLT